MRAHWLLLIVLLLGCDADRFLSGQWTSISPVPLSSLGLSASDDLKVHIELNLGHYGQDVVGVVRFVGTAEHNFDTLGCAALDELPACPCNRVDGTYKASSGKVYFDLVNCNKGKQRTVLHREGDQLAGTLEIVDGTLDIEFEQSATEGELTSSDKACDPCEQSN
jgi:hypothetical protein